MKSVSIRTLAFSGGLLVLLGAAFAFGPRSGYDLSWFTSGDGGLGVSTGGGYELEGTLGQPDAGEPDAPLSGGDYAMTGGFWVPPETTVTGGACCIDPPGPAGATCTEVAEAAACATYVCSVVALRPSGFLGCYGDADGNNVVNPGDRGIISANIGQTAAYLVCLNDLDGNGVINPGDRGIVSANIGRCVALPGWQNGSGVLNNGAPDTRFGTATFHGVGTACATSPCP